MEQFDITVIGSGPAGYVCAIRASQLGYKVCCIEKGQTLGGTCLNIGCIPSKSLLHSSHLFHQASELNQLGINFDNVSFDLNKIMKSKNESVESLTSGIDFLFKKNKVTRKLGFAKFINNEQIEILTGDSSEVIKSSKTIIATGSEVELAMEIANDLMDKKHIRVVSMPCTERFDAQSESYKQQILGTDIKRVAIEASHSDWWRKYVGLEGEVIGMDTYGESAPGNVLFDHFGFTKEKIKSKLNL